MVKEPESIEATSGTDQKTGLEGTGVDTSKSVHDVDQSTLPRDSTTDEVEGSTRAVLSALQPILVRLEQLEQVVTQLAVNVNQLSERAALIPRQVRQLGTRVDDITESVGIPRVRDLLGSLLLLHDLIEQMSRAAESDAPGAQDYKVLQDQIAQVLQLNGVYPIARAERFDPAIHKAVETIPCPTPDEDGEIESVYRTGFRTDQAVLRYAEVVVKRYQSRD